MFRWRLVFYSCRFGGVLGRRKVRGRSCSVPHMVGPPFLQLHLVVLRESRPPKKKKLIESAGNHLQPKEVFPLTASWSGLEHSKASIPKRWQTPMLTPGFKKKILATSLCEPCVKPHATNFFCVEWNQVAERDEGFFLRKVPQVSLTHHLILCSSTHIGTSTTNFCHNPIYSCHWSSLYDGPRSRA